MTPQSDPTNIYKQPPIGVRKDGSSYTAMIIDDSRTAREILKQILMSVQFKIIDESENGELAIKKIQTSSLIPDLIFIDMEMPIMNGSETVKRIKPLLPDTKIFMVTSHGEKNIVMEILNLKISGYIKKPFDRDTVIGKLQSVLKSAGK